MVDSLSNTKPKRKPGPKQTMYKLGRAFEYRCADYLRERGYYVMRSAGSKGVADLVAFRRDGNLFVQCKRDAASQPRLLPLKEREELIRICRLVETRPVAAFYDRDTRAIIWRDVHGALTEITGLDDDSPADERSGLSQSPGTDPGDLLPPA